MRNDPAQMDPLIPAAGPLDHELQELQQRVESAEQVLEDARQARAELVTRAHQQGYSIYRIGRLTGRRKPSAIHRDLTRSRRGQ